MRRKRMGGAAVGFATLVSWATALLAQGGGTAAAEHAEWGYVGATGPSHWAELSEDYAVCATGRQGSPIDLADAVPADVGPLAIDWSPVPLTVANNGHTVQVPTDGGGTLTLHDRRFALAQFHVHHPSEHLLAGRRFPLEIHFVHQGKDGTLAVLAVLVREGAPHPEPQKVLDEAPATAGTTERALGAVVDPTGLLPAERGHHRHQGSLTTPSCSEGVFWAVLSAPIEASVDQIDAFEALSPMNARPIQAANGRPILKSR